MAFGIAAQLRPFALQRSHPVGELARHGAPGAGRDLNRLPLDRRAGDDRLGGRLEQRPARRDRAEEARVRGRRPGRVGCADGEPDRLADVPVAELVARGRGAAHSRALRPGGVAAVPLEAVRDVAEARPVPLNPVSSFPAAAVPITLRQADATGPTEAAAPRVSASPNAPATPIVAAASAATTVLRRRVTSEGYGAGRGRLALGGHQLGDSGRETAEPARVRPPARPALASTGASWVTQNVPSVRMLQSGSHRSEASFPLLPTVSRFEPQILRAGA